MKKKFERIGIRIDTETKEKLEAVAGKKGYGNFVRKLIQIALEER